MHTPLTELQVIAPDIAYARLLAFSGPGEWRGSSESIRLVLCQGCVDPDTALE